MLGLDDAPGGVAAVVIGPNDPAAMMRLCRECRERKIPFVFDPAHQLPRLDVSDLTEATEGAWILIGNDYEIELIKERMRCDHDTLMRHADMVVTTLGRDGSRITSRDGVTEIPAAPSGPVVDPTGAGDAYRAGLVAGLLRGLDVAVSGRVASLAATYAIEQVGTAEHAYSRDEFSERYRQSFGSYLSDQFWLGSA